jgi:hypothetical protein
LGKTREEHTGNTIIKRYNGDGTIMWGPGERASEKDKAEQACGGRDGTKKRETSQ